MRWGICACVGVRAVAAIQRRDTLASPKEKPCDPPRWPGRPTREDRSGIGGPRGQARPGSVQAQSPGDWHPRAHRGGDRDAETGWNWHLPGIWEWENPNSLNITTGTITEGDCNYYQRIL